MRGNAPSPRAHKHKTTSGTSLSTSESNRRTAQPERRPEGQDASEVLCEAYHPLCLCARLALSMTGVFELDLATYLGGSVGVNGRFWRRLPCGVAAAAPLSHKQRLCASFRIFLIRHPEIQSFSLRLFWSLKKQATCVVSRATNSCYMIGGGPWRLVSMGAQIRV
jgi:hypothetical protein